MTSAAVRIILPLGGKHSIRAEPLVLAGSVADLKTDLRLVWIHVEPCRRDNTPLSLLVITTVMHTKGNCSQQLAEGYWPCKLLAEGVVKKMVAFLALSMSVPTLATTYAVTPSSNAAAAQRRTLVDAYLRANGTTMVKGGTMRVTAYGAYSDGSVESSARCGGKRGDCLEHQQSCAGPGEQRRRSHGGGYRDG